MLSLSFFKRLSKPNSIFSFIVSHGSSLCSWKTTPLLIPGPFISCPFRRIIPESLVSRPAIIFSRVLFPQPLCPTIVINSPFFISIFMFSSTFISFLFIINFFSRFLISSIISENINSFL